MRLPGLALIVAAVLLAAAVAVSHRYAIQVTACSPSEEVCSRAWMVDQWTGVMSFCEYKGLPDCVRVRDPRRSSDESLEKPSGKPDDIH